MWVEKTSVDHTQLWALLLVVDKRWKGHRRTSVWRYHHHQAKPQPHEPSMFISQGEKIYLIEKVTWSKVSWRHFTSCHISLMSLLQSHVFFFFFFFFSHFFFFFNYKNKKFFWKFDFISVNLMSIATFFREISKIYH